MEAAFKALRDSYVKIVASLNEYFSLSARSNDRNKIDAALERFKIQIDIFRAVCDKTEDFVYSAKERILMEGLAEEAAGNSAVALSSEGIPIRFDEMSNAVRNLVMEIQSRSNPAPGEPPLSQADDPMDVSSLELESSK